MAKEIWKPGNMLYPLPAVMVSMADRDGKYNIITIGWAGTVCTNPPMVSISVRPERHSFRILQETGEFVINLTTRELAFATDYCGVKSGRDVDKFKALGLTAFPAKEVKAPLSILSAECARSRRWDRIICFWLMWRQSTPTRNIWTKSISFIWNRQTPLSIRMGSIMCAEKQSVHSDTA